MTRFRFQLVGLLLGVAGASEASALGPGCDYDAYTYLHSIQDETADGTESISAWRPVAEPGGESGEPADREVEDETRDIVLHVPMCLNDLDAEISRVVAECSVYFDESITVAQGRGDDGVSATSSDQIDVEYVVEGDALGRPPVVVDTVAELVIDLEDRSDLYWFSHAACTLNVARGVDTVAEVISQDEMDITSLGDVYRAAGRDFVYVPVIDYTAATEPR